MKNIFIKIAAFTLAFLVLFSTFSFTVEKHYCGDFLLDVSFSVENIGCGMIVDGVVSTKKKKCCTLEVHEIEGQDELQSHKIDKLTFEKEQFLTAFVYFQNYFVGTEFKNSFYKDFSPPDISVNYQVLHQTFLI
jgi:hypothetical protein